MDPVDAEEEEMMSGWDLVDRDCAPSEPAPKPAQPESPGFFAMLSSTKWVGQIYNMYQRYPVEPPLFSEEIIHYLGHFAIPSPEERKSGTRDPKTGQYYHATRFLDYVAQNVLWFSYRRDFPLIPSYDATSDIGWGCLVRTTQMMLARVFMTLHETHDQRFDKEAPPPKSNVGRFQIIQWFQDTPSPKSPYSIHNVIQESQAVYGLSKRHMTGGEWFSPTRVSMIFERLVNRHVASGIKMVVCKDSIIFTDSIESLCTQPSTKLSTSTDQPDTPNTTNPNPNNNNEPESNTTDGSIPATTSHTTPTPKGDYEEGWTPVWILIPSLLGLGKINDIYLPHLRHLLSSLFSAGIIGGRPRASLYFIGVQGPNVFYLDPHIVQEAVKPSNSSASLDAKAFNTYRPQIPATMPIGTMDPSMGIGIFCKTRLEWETFKIEHRSFQETGHPLIFCLGTQN